MSRFVQHNQKYEMAYGQDHICGLFIQIFERACVNDDDEGLRVNLDQRFDGLTPTKMSEVAEEHGFHIELPEETINYE
jgi:hypothetical protein